MPTKGALETLALRTCLTALTTGGVEENLEAALQCFELGILVDGFGLLSPSPGDDAQAAVSRNQPAALDALRPDSE